MPDACAAGRPGAGACSPGGNRGSDRHSAIHRRAPDDSVSGRAAGAGHLPKRRNTERGDAAERGGAFAGITGGAGRTGDGAGEHPDSSGKGGRAFYGPEPGKGYYRRDPERRRDRGPGFQRADEHPAAPAGGAGPDQGKAEPDDSFRSYAEIPAGSDHHHAGRPIRFAGESGIPEQRSGACARPVLQRGDAVH